MRACVHAVGDEAVEGDHGVVQNRRAGCTAMPACCGEALFDRCLAAKEAQEPVMSAGEHIHAKGAVFHHGVEDGGRTRSAGRLHGLPIDFVQAYFEPSSPLYAGVDAALASALRIRAAARSKSMPVILTGVVLHPNGLDGGRFFQKAKPLACFTAGNPLGAWPTGLAPYPDEFVVTKQYTSAFLGTSLAPFSSAWASTMSS